MITIVSLQNLLNSFITCIWQKNQIQNIILTAKFKNVNKQLSFSVKLMKTWTLIFEKIRILQKKKIMRISATLLSQNIRLRTDYKWFLPFQTRWLDNDRFVLLFYGFMWNRKNNFRFNELHTYILRVFWLKH